MKRILAAAGTAAVLIGTAAGLAGMAAEAPASTGVVAVLRRDGVLLPFARFKGHDWVTKWPGSTRSQTLPINLASIPRGWWAGPAPGDWQAWLVDGTRQPLDVDAPALYRTGCETRIGLRTGYRSTRPLPVPAVEPYPKDGLAISDGMPLQPIERVDPAQNRGPRLLEILGPELNAVEDRLLRRIRNNTSWRHPVGEGIRHDTPVRFEAWYRGRDGEGLPVSYVELVRSYPPRPEDEGCGVETFFTGWVFEDPQDPGDVKSALSARATYCDRSSALYMLPFGSLVTGERTYWIYQLSGWDEEWYAVTRVDRRRAVPTIEYFGGGAGTCRGMAKGKE